MRNGKEEMAFGRVLPETLSKEVWKSWIETSLQLSIGGVVVDYGVAD